MTGSPNGVVFNVQRHSTEDGPGIRTTVFVKGCPLHCPWCQNPEGIQSAPQLVWYEIRCIGAKDCLAICPTAALEWTPSGIIIDRRLCNVCGECVRACPSGALEALGREYTVEQIVAEVLRDQPFHEKSGGGVTLSGGEPSLQRDFCLAVVQALKRQGIHTALDTSGGVAWILLEPLVDLVDLVLYDIKLIDHEQHLKYIGIPLDLILSNARRISDTGKPMWIRTPAIPGYTATTENIRGIARFIKENLTAVARYDILALNKACSSKYRRLAMDWSLADANLVDSSTMEDLARAAREEGLGLVRWSGLTSGKQ